MKPEDIISLKASLGQLKLITISHNYCRRELWAFLHHAVQEHIKIAFELATVWKLLIYSSEVSHLKGDRSCSNIGHTNSKEWANKIHCLGVWFRGEILDCYDFVPTEEMERFFFSTVDYDGAGSEIILNSFSSVLYHWESQWLHPLNL